MGNVERTLPPVSALNRATDRVGPAECLWLTWSEEGCDGNARRWTDGWTQDVFPGILCAGS